MSNPTHAEFIQGLRELAQFYSEHPEVKLPLATTYYICDATKEEILAAARAFGHAEKTYFDHSFILRKRFPSGVDIAVMTARETVCTPREVGERLEPGYVVPEQRVPDRMVPIFEWDCHPLLAEKEVEI